MGAHWSLLEWLALVEHELLLFAGIFFLVGALDELCVDGVWLWQRLKYPRLTQRLDRSDVRSRTLGGHAAVFIPAWREEAVIEHTIAHALRSWTHADYTLYVGCYGNDAATFEAAMRGAGCDARVRLVIHDVEGPTTKADCLNRLYTAMQVDERRRGTPFRMIVLHDAEDMVDPAELGLLDRAIERSSFVQLPVVPLPQRESRWIGSHYCEEFAEAHGKTMVVRDMLGVALPAAGVGCAFERGILAEMARIIGTDGPFSIDSLTEDYELGMRIELAGGTSRFLRVRGDDGTLIGTRAYFPSRIDEAVRQKSRWVHGIALQGWDRLGWSGGIAEFWMRLRDRRGPFAALVLACGYAFFLLTGLFFLLGGLGVERPWQTDPLLAALLVANLASFAWRAAMRFAFTAREYGLVEGARAVLRIPVANIISIMAGRRALFAYVRTVTGGQPQWDKTMHYRHPAAEADRLEEAAA